MEVCTTDGNESITCYMDQNDIKALIEHLQRQLV